MKVLYSDPATLRAGDAYCQQNCKMNLTEKSRKCLEYGVIGCAVCDSILKPNNPKYQYSQSICQTFCNKYKKTEFCRFYEFKIVVKKKIQNELILPKKKPLIVGSKKITESKKDTELQKSKFFNKKEIYMILINLI